MFSWKLKQPADGIVVGPEERLPWPQTMALGAQHVVAMFGGTVLGLLLMGFDANVAVLMSGVGTLIFFFTVGGRVPSYLSSSFSFIGVVIAATGYSGQDLNTNIEVALGGIIVCGAVYTAIGLAVMATGTGWIERLMPPVVTGSVVAVIGLNLAALPIKTMAHTAFEAWIQAVTFFAIALVAAYSTGMMRRLLILVGLVLATAIYAVLTNGLGWGKPIDFRLIENAAYIGRAFVGDGVATMVSGAVGGSGVTTYAENIGVMAATRIYSTAMFVVAALIAILLGFSPKFVALIHTIPLPAMGGSAS